MTWLLAGAMLLPTSTDLSPAQLDQDHTVLRRALSELHPGLNLHRSPAVIELAFQNLKIDWSKAQDRRSTYLALSKMLGQVRCGHTYANVYNQTAEVAKEVLDGRDKLPFTFELVEKRMLVVAGREIPSGSEVLEIDGVPVGKIVDRLVPLVKADGGNDAKRLDDLNTAGLGRYEAFDVLHPLVFPPKRSGFTITYQGPAGVMQKRVEAVTRAERAERLRLREDPLWVPSVLPGGIGYLPLQSFTTWNFRFDWRRRLETAFDRFRSEAPKHLIIDIRGNEGGDDSVIAELGRYLVKEPLTLNSPPSYIKFDTVAADLRPYLSSWNPAVFELGKGTVVESNGLRRRPGVFPTRLQPKPNAFAGKVWMLVGPSNSSATFHLARAVKQHGLATLVGRVTGGSLKGTTGGQFLVLTLPNSKITVDIPLVTSPSDLPDQGVTPDLLTSWTFEKRRSGIDPDMEAVLKATRTQK